MQTNAQTLDVSVAVAQGLDRLTKRVLLKYPRAECVFRPLLPVMCHLQTILELPRLMKRIGAEAARAIAGSEHFDPSKCAVLNGIKEGGGRPGNGRRRGGASHRAQHSVFRDGAAVVSAVEELEAAASA